MANAILTAAWRGIDGTGDPWGLANPETMRMFGRTVWVILAVQILVPPAWSVDTGLEAELQATIELTQARARIRGRDYAGALPLLEAARDRQSGNADIHSLLGFVSRKLGRFPQAHAHYRQALDLDPHHRAAHEYLGELHLQEGDPDAAAAVLARLARLCPSGCEERDELESAIVVHRLPVADRP